MKFISSQNAVLSSLLLVGLLVLTGCSNSQSTNNSTQYTEPPVTALVATEIREIPASPLDMLQIALPRGFERQRVSETKETFLQSDRHVGGIILVDIANSVFDDILNRLDNLTPIVMDTMETEMGVEQFGWQFGASSLYGLYEFEMGDNQTEYRAYLLRGMKSCYVVWFDRKQVDADMEEALMQSISSEDIPKELNRLTNEEYADAIAESMAKEEYDFVFDLPNGITRNNISEDSALLYKDGIVIGGYKTVHFEKGILPAAKENQQIILDYLRENVMKEIDPGDFNAEITNDSVVITAEFSNDSKKYTHNILSYGQVGTQYDLWFDAAALDQTTRANILWSGRVEVR